MYGSLQHEVTGNQTAIMMLHYTGTLELKKLNLGKASTYSITVTGILRHATRQQRRRNVLKDFSQAITSSFESRIT